MATTPALPVPGGGQPNFVDPFDKGPYEVPSTYILVVLALLLYINRIYVKFYTTKKPWWDDLTCSLGFAFALIKVGGYIYMTTRGPIGKHQWNVSLAEISDRNYLVATWLNGVWTPPAQCFIKLTLFLIYWQIFWVLNWVRIAIYIGATFTTLFYTAMTIAYFVVATPRPGQTWAEQAVSKDAMTGHVLELALTLGGVVINLYLLCLPIRALFKLQLPIARKVRIAIACVFGLIACVCSGASIQYGYAVYRTDDKTWATLSVENMVVDELYIGIMVSCLPQFAVSMSQLFGPGVKRVRSYISSQKSKAAGSNSEASENSELSPRMSRQREPHQIGEKKTVHVFVEERRDSSRGDCGMASEGVQA
ncbi:MAG: hypothetical protein M1828_000099 [Chrysothrix sp. TS-e1954]|nr:MAG: hypothetical protein M1828_000099 [Chrysothrix sp. TS-e1954]